MAHVPRLILPLEPAARPVSASGWRTQLAIVSGLQMAHLLFESVRTDHAMLFAGLLDWMAYKGDESIRLSINVLATVVALQYIDRRGKPRPHRTPAALLAMMAAALASAAVASFIDAGGGVRAGAKLRPPASRRRRSDHRAGRPAPP
ncbi:hypothetical protein [Piscinibacter sp.]|uniref:hypothetical protein n=1 Tax=Piscinibacter sp. TaxID=1903157 RepID=UPI002BF1539B|nr:hypothetical protein [Albitalea sp.]HUG23983.1 hypothetical protein [Albitalea sp.]